MGKMARLRLALRSCVNKPVAYQMMDGYGASIVPTLVAAARFGHKVEDADIYDAISGGTYTGPMVVDEQGVHFVHDDDEDDDRAKKIRLFAGPTLIPGGPDGRATAYVSAKGVAMYDVEYQPYAFSTLLLSQIMNGLANDPQVGQIILDIGSPGGMVTGTVEAADAVYAAAKKKKVLALVNPLAASAAYWIASQATEIVSVKSGDVGSIGVFMAHTDCSAFNEQQGMKITYIYAGPHKVEGNADEPLAESARTHFQSEVDSIYSDFLKAVARGRDTTVENVMASFGGGRTLMAPAAKKAGMIDEIASIDSAFARWGVMTTAAQRRRGETETPAPAAETPNETREELGLPPVESLLEGATRVETADIPPIVTATPEEPAQTETPPVEPKKASRRRRLALLST